VTPQPPLIRRPGREGFKMLNILLRVIGYEDCTMDGSGYGKSVALGGGGHLGISCGDVSSATRKQSL
jgi:hypothetical protein